MDKIYIEITKDLTLPELIQYAWDNNIKNKDYTSSRNIIVRFDDSGQFYCYGYSSAYFSKEDTFTILTKEPLTEDTILDNILAVEEVNDTKQYNQYHNKSISQISNSLEIHLLQPDNTFKRIWTKDRGILTEPTSLFDSNMYDYLTPTSIEEYNQLLAKINLKIDDDNIKERVYTGYHVVNNKGDYVLRLSSKNKYKVDTFYDGFDELSEQDKKYLMQLTFLYLLNQGNQ